MAIEIKIPKDIRKYEPKLIGPFTTRQTLCLIPAVVLGVVMNILLAKNGVAMDVCIFATTIVALPFLLLGWYKPYSLPLEKFLKSVMISMLFAPKYRKYKTIRLYDEIDRDNGENKKSHITNKTKKNSKSSTDPLFTAYK